MEPATSKWGWLGPVTLVAALLYSLYAIISTVYWINATGKLNLSASDPKAIFSVTQTNSQAYSAGQGKPHIRLKPGTYIISATANGRQTVGTIEISKHQSASLYLDLAKSSALPSALDVSFSGFSALTDKGLTSDQTNSLQYAFFKFRPTAKSVQIDTTSIKTAAHNPSDSSFKINFLVSVDSKNYNALVSYAGLTDIRLFLYEPGSNSQAFDSKVISPK